MAINLNNPQAFQQFIQPGQQSAGVSQNQRPQPAGQQQNQQQPQQAQPVQRKQAGTGFTNVGQVVKANVGQGQKMGNQIAQNYANQVGSSLGQINQQNQQQQQQVQNEQNRLAQADQFNQQIQQDPTQIAANQQQMQQFQQLYNPLGASQQQQAQFQQQQQQAQQTLQQQQQQLQGLGTQEGRLGALQKMYQGPGYSQGQQKLDQLVLGQAGLPAIQQQRQQLQQQLAGAKGQQELTGKQLLANIQANMQKEREASDLLHGTLGTQTQDFISAQEKEAADLQASNQTNADIYRRFLQGDQTLNEQQRQQAIGQLQSAGLNAGTRTYNVLSGTEGQGYANYLNAPGMIKAADVVSQPEFQKYQALAQLAGTSPEQMQYQQAGSGGQVAGIKAQQLADDIKKAEQQFGQYAQQGQTYSQGGQAITGRLSDYLQQQLNPSQYYQGMQGMGFDYSDPSGRTGSGRAIIGGNNIGDTAYRLLPGWMSMENQNLQQQGYGNVLGGGTASNEIPQSLIDLWKQQS